MRLQRLQMTALGPFRDFTELDLSRFGESGLFLIEGPTGAGKSTILDAISFALYGKTAQAAASIERLKSHHSPLGTEPVVELVFETQSGRYRIRRTAPYERAKKRGTGTLPVRMTVALYRLTDPDDLDGGELISNNLGDAEDEITRAVGLSHGQFVQTVLLPQGEFANFLSARTEAKRDLLQKLFGTEILQRTQANLVEGRQLALRRRAGSVEGVRAAVNAFAGVTAMADRTVAELIAAAERGAPEVLLAATTDELGSLAAASEAASNLLRDAEQARITADSQLQVHSELDQRRRRRSELRQRETELLAAADDQSAAVAELSSAERALGVASAADGARSALAALDDGRQAEALARAALPENLVDADERQLRESVAATTKTLGGLAAEHERERTLPRRRLALEQLQADWDQQISLIHQGETSLMHLPLRRRELEAAQLTASRAADRLPDLLAERDRAVIRLAAAEKAEIAAVAAAQEMVVFQELFESCDLAEQRFSQLQQQWRANIASELGLALQVGDPCSVCGSVEHPRPARPSADHVSQDQVAQAERDLSGLRNQVESRRAQLAEKQADLLSLQLQADQLTPSKARSTLDAIADALDLISAEADRLPGLTEELRSLDDQLEQLRTQLEEARQDSARRGEHLAAQRADVERDEQATEQARAEFPSVAARMAALHADLLAIEHATDLIEATRSLLATAAKAGEIFAAALAEAGFEDEAAWRSARRGSAVVAQLREQVRRYDEQLGSVRSRLSAEELSDPALDQPPSDLDALRQAAVAANQLAQQAAQAHGAATNRLAKATELAAKLGLAVDRSAAVLTETAAAIRVGNLVAGLGDNQLKMELTTYVLVRRFAEVLAAANGQLQRISQGRYQLEHTDARTGSAKSGLNLRVLDLHTGRPRDPATLSGGETFYVSLALALGLAEVVRAESGGIDLGTLFIDEGFGTLDAEVLDEVIDVLDGLRNGGRAVGIVSHVTELKMRIADRIKVDRRVDGTSRLLTTV